MADPEVTQDEEVQDILDGVEIVFAPERGSILFIRTNEQGEIIGREMTQQALDAVIAFLEAARHGDAHGYGLTVETPGKKRMILSLIDEEALFLGNVDMQKGAWS